MAQQPGGTQLLENHESKPNFSSQEQLALRQSNKLAPEQRLVVPNVHRARQGRPEGQCNQHEPPNSAGASDEDQPETSTAEEPREPNVGNTRPSSSDSGQRPKRQRMRLNESQKDILHSVLDDYIAGVLSTEKKQQVAYQTGLTQKKVLKYLNDCYRAVKKKSPAVTSLRMRPSGIGAATEPLQPAIDLLDAVVVMDALTGKRITTFAPNVPSSAVLDALRAHPGPGRLERDDLQRTVLSGEPSLPAGIYQYFLSRQLLPGTAGIQQQL